MPICTFCGQEWPDDYKLCPNDGSSLSNASDKTDIVGSVLADRYHIKKKLGEGGMGAVYLAEHVRMGQEVAIKVASRSLASDPDAIARFTREARNAARIKHPNVCVVHDFGESSNGLVYLAMEFVEGGSLSEVLKRAGKLPLEQAATIVRQCCNALQAAHDLDIVHRDIKPDNIMVTVRRDETVFVKLVDFGIAKAFAPEEGQAVTKTGFIVGTPDYMSPEQVSGAILDGRSDVYSLALVLFRMLTDRLPFEADTPQGILMSRLTSKPLKLVEVLPQSALPPRVQEVLDRALARECEERYATASEFGQAVAAAVLSADTERHKADVSIEQTASAETEVIDTTGPTLLVSATPTPETPQPATTPKTPQRRAGMKLALFGSVGVVAIGVTWVITGTNTFRATNGGEQPANANIPGTTAENADPADSIRRRSEGTDDLATSGRAATVDSTRVNDTQDREGPDENEGGEVTTETDLGLADATPDSAPSGADVSPPGDADHNRTAAWATVDHGLSTAELHGIWGGPTDLWVVGGNGTLLHYDGTSWDHGLSLEQVREFGSLLESAGFQALWGSAPNDVWAVGSSIFHYNGNAWLDVTPDLDLEWLRAVWGSNPGDIWAVGNRGYIIHYDNGTWVDVNADLTGEDLLGVWGSGPANVWAVGEGGIILHYDGTSWTDATPEMDADWLNAIWGTGPTDVWAVGNGGTILHHDGSQWSDVAPLRRFSNGQVGPAVNWDIYGITGLGPNDIWIATNGPVYHYDGNSWTDQTPGGNHRLYNVWAAGSRDIWAIGWWGMMMRLKR